MILAAHQPNHLPYLGFFNKMMLSDILILTDIHQFEKHDFQNRNRIRTKDGWEWMTVPVFTKDRSTQNIIEVIIDNKTKWAKTHWHKLLNNYGRAPFFKYYAPFFEKLYSQQWESLAELNKTLIFYIIKELGINTKIELSSNFRTPGQRTDFLINLTLKFGADTYLSGPGGKGYLEEQKFADNGIKLVYQEYQPIPYRQCFEPFIPNMAVIDAMFNHGNDQSREIILKSSSRCSQSGSNPVNRSLV
ncbi:WbqC family protein [Candidatus Bathyarchaeota archaeon]|nr:WbqC family protein [Candidatus Bathyarchaeota archaeon]